MFNLGLNADGMDTAYKNADAAIRANAMLKGEMRQRNT